MSLLQRTSDTLDPALDNQEPKGYLSLLAGTEESLGPIQPPLLKGPLLCGYL